MQGKLGHKLGHLKAVFRIPRKDPHHFGERDADPHQNEKLDPDPHQREKVEALEGHYGALEGPNWKEKVSCRIRISTKLKGWIRIRIKLKGRIRIPIKSEKQDPDPHQR